jgi:hypothetical protein
MPDIVNFPIMYINGCIISFPNTETITISTGKLRDSTNRYDITVNSELTISTLVVGPGGLDVGPLAIERCYNIFIISDSSGFTPTSAILSLSEIPYLPGEYNLFRKIGFCGISGGSDIFTMYQNGNGSERIFTFSGSVFVLLPGHSTTFADVDLSTYIPSVPNNILITFLVTYTPHAVGNIFTLKSPSSDLILTNSGTGLIAGQDQTSQITLSTNLVNGNPSVSYMVQDAGDELTLSLSSVYLSL